MSKHTALLTAAVAAVLAAALVAAAGVALGSGQTTVSSIAQPGRMGGMGMHVGSEFDYLTQMIPHHNEAIAAAKVLQQGTERATMRAFAGTIVKTQSAEVAQMDRWLAAWYPGRDTRVDYEPMMRKLSGLRANALDRAFLQDMVSHHMMAVMMSQQLLVAGLAEHREVVAFATRIRNTQHNEIRKMNSWLGAWYGTAGTGMGMGMGMGGMMGHHGMMGH